MNKIWALSSLFFTIISLTATLAQAIETKKPHQKADFLTTVDKNKDGKASKAEFFAAMNKKFHSLDVDKSEAVSVQELKIYGEKDEEARKQAQQAAKLATVPEKKISKMAFITLFSDRAEQEFTELDKNHDNQLNADEVGAKKTKQKKKSKNKRHQVKKPMTKADFVALFTKKAEHVFPKLDKNRDNKLSDSELGIKPKSTLTPEPKVEPALSELPKPSAQAPSSSQQPVDNQAQQQKVIKSFFADIDANNDGNISNKEKTVVFERLFNRLDTNHDQFITQEEIIAGGHVSVTEQP